MLFDEVGVMSHDPAKHERDEEGVVQLSGDRDEVRDQIERQGEVGDQGCQEQLLPSRQPFLP